MACPTCGHTMQRVADAWFWCPRCGTVSESLIGGGSAPKLVERCREFEAVVRRVNNGSVREWYRLGIAESIHLPEDRPEHTEEELKGGTE